MEIEAFGTVTFFSSNIVFTVKQTKKHLLKQIFFFFKTDFY